MADGESIVLTIEGDAAGADEALSAAEASLDSMQESFAGIAEAADAMSASVEEALSGIEEASAAAEASLGSVAAAGDDAATSLGAAGGAADSAAGSFSGVDGAAGTAAASISAEGDAAEGAAAKNRGLADSNDKVASGLGKMRMPLLIAGAAVVGLGALAVHMAGDFQDSMMQLVTGAGESKSNLALVSAGVLSLSDQVGTSAKNMAAGMYMIESAGYHGAAGLTVLQAAAEGAKVGGADMADVANGVTTALTDYHLSVSQAAMVTNDLVATVASGKTHMQDLASSLSTILPTASAAGVSLKDTTAALATMTGEGTGAAQAATYLRQTILALEAPSALARKTLESVGLTTDQVAAEMKQSLPDALAMITDAVGKKFPVGSAEYVAAIKDITGGTKTMQGMLELTGTHLSTFQQNVQGITSAVKAGGKSITGWSLVQGDFNTQMAQFGVSVQNAMISVGTALLPVITALTNGLKPVLAWVATHGAVVAAVLGGLAVVITGTLIGAMIALTAAEWATIAPALAIIGPVIAITAGITLLAAGIILAYQHFGLFRAAVNAVGSVLGHVAGFFAHNTAALSALKFMVAGAAAGLLVFAATAVPPLLAGFGAWAVAAGAAAVATLAAVWPFLAVGAAIGGLIFIIVEVVRHWTQIREAIGRFVAFVKTHVGAFFSWFGSGLHNAFDGARRIVQDAVTFIKDLITGYFNLYRTIISDALHFIVGLFSWLYDHNTFFKRLVDAIVAEFTRAKQFVTTIWTDIKGFLSGVWHWLQHAATAAFDFVVAGIRFDLNLAKSIITSVWNAVTGFLGGVWTWIHTTATKVWDDLIGFVGGLAGRALAAVKNGVITPITSAIKGLVGEALSWGENLIKQFVAGITSQIGNVKNAVGNIAGKIGSFLGFHSPAKEGPGATADQWAPSLMRMFAAGIIANAGLVHAAALTAAHSLASGLAGGVGGVGAGNLSVPGGNFGGIGGIGASVASAAVASAATSGAGSLGSGAGAGASGMTRQDAQMLAGKLDVLHSDLQAIARAATSSGGNSSANTPHPMLPTITLNGGAGGNINQIAAQLNQLGGYAAEYANRGAIAGVAYNG